MGVGYGKCITTIIMNYGEENVSLLILFLFLPNDYILRRKVLKNLL